MGLSDEQDIVALCGGHTLIRTMYPKVSMGETHKDRSKFEEGKSTNKPLKFDNSYFKELLIKDASFSRLPMDYALVEDPKFHHYVERYARRGKPTPPIEDSTLVEHKMQSTKLNI
ncbi:hypothetical protein GLYMA_11G080901v4 [Glycine max]|nr:hypothetical protein GLYMA_11G080901v4 [Glycine max]KAG4386587.1 hypothetical protein GLYMA_11G080901v4 [Glycine max]KAG4386588.1 hypothetical protein GLYMA_11G080901v4 [Glycine max]